MKQLATRGIILSRTDYGEADRILTLLTPDYGKVRVMARGVRRIKSKLAGGVELFSISDIVFIKGRGDIGTLVSSRLVKHYGAIVKDLDRTMLTYDCIRQVHKLTEDEVEHEYFDLLEHAFEGLDDRDVPVLLVRFWFVAQLLKLSGHMPNLETDNKGMKLAAGRVYDFSFDHMTFAASPQGRFTPQHITFLRLAFSPYSPKVLARVRGVGDMHAATASLLETLVRTSLHL